MPLTIDVETPDGGVSWEGVVYVVRYHGKNPVASPPLPSPQHETDPGFGTPYTLGFTALVHGIDATLIVGHGVYTPEIRRAIGLSAKKLGIERILYERRRGKATIPKMVYR